MTATIYRKSPLGLAEIAGTGQRRLPPRLRSVLIMVDGRRSDADLRALSLPALTEAVASLLEQGFIEVAEVITGRQGSPRPAAPGSSASSSSPVAGAAPQQDFASRRRQAVREFTDLVGPLAEALALRMERAGDDTALTPLLATAATIVRNTRGEGAASAFAARFLPSDPTA